MATYTLPAKWSNSEGYGSFLAKHSALICPRDAAKSISGDVISPWMGKAMLVFFVPSLASYIPTNLLVDVAIVVGAGGSTAAIGEGAVAADDGVGVAMATPFAWASLSFRQNFFQWYWMQHTN